jgi:CRP-like cAMP-binding protein
MAGERKVPQAREAPSNRLLAALKPPDLALLWPALEAVTLKSGEVLFEPKEDVKTVHFPGRSTLSSLVLNFRDGASAETALIGPEGAIGGIVSEGNKPAFTRGVVEMGGPALRLPVHMLERAKLRSPALRDHFARYADCLLAEVLQSVACNAVHEFDARLARWLLSVQDRLGTKELHITQESIAEMLGVGRTYATRALGELMRKGMIDHTRGVIVIVARRKLERQACECYSYLRRHFERLLPGVYAGD